MTLGPAIAWLRTIRNLSYFSSNTFNAGIYFRSPGFQGLFNMFNHELRKHQLKNLQLASEQDFLQHPTLKRLRSLEQLTLSENREHPPFESSFLKSGIYSKVFPKLLQLKHLEITDSLQVSTAAHILNSFPHPQNVRSLAFKLYHKYDVDYKSCSQFKWALLRFDQLKHFKLNFVVGDPFLFIIEPLGQCSLLEKLDLTFNINTESKIIDQLAIFICKFPKLIDLKLTLILSEDSSVKSYETQIIFLIKQISSLQKLEFLDVVLSREDGVLSEASNEVIMTFYQTINQLKHLKKFDLKGLKRNFAKEFTSFMETLSQKCLNFNNLELNFCDVNFKTSDLMTFIDVLRNATNLESLSLRGFLLKDELICKKLFQVLMNTKNLKKVYLAGAKLQLDKQLFLDLFKPLTMKKELKSLFIFYDKAELTGENSDELMDAIDILKNNSSLIQLNLGGVLNGKILSNRLPLSHMKWD